MYIHLQSLRALHPALRSEVTNTMLEKLHPWCDEKRIFLPGSTVQGCLACALGLLYNDTGAMNALAVLGKSWFRRGVGYGRLVEEGWLGWWAEETKGVREVRADRKKARRETGVSNAEWVDRGEGVEFRDVVWGQKPSRQQQKRGSAITMGRQQGEKREEVRLMGPPARPERVKGQTLWTREESKMERISATRFPDLQGPKSAVAEEEKEEEEEKRWSGTTLGSTRYSTKPPTPEKSKPRGQYQHVDRSPVSPLSPRSRPGFPEAGNRPTSFHNQQAPTMRRTKTDATQHSRARKEVSIPPPLNPHRPTLAHNRARYPYESQRPHSSTTSHPLAPQNPFTDSPPISSSPSTTSSSWTSSISDTESIVGPSILDGDYSDSDSEYEDDNAYGERDRDTRQRYLDEHDELMKLVGAPGWSRGKPRTRDYLNTLPLREETRERTTRTRGGEVSVA
ncbi:MAG: hypothetical protein LQ343_000967 [Gyalolechia ehrenbergii]|nr:MAG: hypothetical protein LQ343_000967 [Gyalolechia ehrenbergii]